MKKKILVILAVVVGIVGGGGGIAYFFFWEDILLLLGETPKGKSGGKAGGVDLVQEFSESASPAKPAMPAGSGTEDVPSDGSGGTDIVSAPDGEVDEVSVVETPSADQGADAGAESEDEDAQEPAEPVAPPAKAADPVPTLTRKTAAPQRAAAPPAGSAAPRLQVPASPTPARSVAPPTPKSEIPPAPKPAVTPPPKPQRPPETKPAGAKASGSESIEVQKKAQMLIQRRNYRDAEIMLARYLAANPTDGDVHFMAGFLQIQQNRKAMAVPHFQQAAQAALDPQIRQMAEQYLKKLR